MSAESRYWRLRGTFLRFEGSSDNEGNPQFPPRPTDIVLLKGAHNGQDIDVNPLEGEVIYQAPRIATPVRNK